MAYLYKHIRNDNNTVFYIGIGRYKKRAYSTKGRNTHWNNIANKYGYYVDIIEENISWEMACEKEKYWIKLYGREDLKEGTLVNMTDGGDGQIGRVVTDETKLKISLANIHKTLTSEHKNKISQSIKGKSLSETHKKNLSESLMGKPHSDVHKLNISKSMKGKGVGKTHSEETKEKIRNAVLKKIAEKNKKVH